MNGFASERSSGCESGWTMYLDQSSVPVNPCKRDDGGVFSDQFFHGKGAKEEGEEEEDLSMVSDASSGPPHFHEYEDYCDENGCFWSASASSTSALVKKSGKRQKMEEHRRLRQDQQHPSLFDDTASSPVLSVSKNNFSLTTNQDSMDNVLDFSQGYSATHAKGRSALQKHFLLLKPPLPGKPN